MLVMKTKLAFLSLAASILFFSCKKNSSDSSNTPPSTGTEQDKLMDSVYLYSQEVYFWNSVLPSYSQFNPRQYAGSDELTSATNVMNAIRKLELLDRYSFVLPKKNRMAYKRARAPTLDFL